MRFIDTKSFQLVEVFEHDAEPYAILSHTWGSDEISFQEMQSGNPNIDKQGYRKIVGCCEQAVEDGFNFAWVDTCCIDKSSSAELSESINSMFRWYQRAAVCYAYLADVPSHSGVHHRDQAVRKSRWFTRGWTLQELIAPSRVIFFTKDWKRLGDKTDLTPLLVEITDIAEIALSSSDMEGFSIAQRMSWASKRVTTRSEDIAYCLMGIFDVNIPLLYGEGGEKAFLRLQEELLRTSNDQSLFVWGNVNARDSGQDQRQQIFTMGRKLLCPTEGQHLLAKSPANFARFGTAIPFHRTPENGSTSLTNKGVRLTGLLIHHSPSLPRDERHGCTVLLDCHFAGDLYGQIGIHLGQCTNSRDRYSRTLSDPVVVSLTTIPHAVEETIHVKGPEVARCISGQPGLPTGYEKGSCLVIPKYNKRGDLQLSGVFPPEGWRQREGLYSPWDAVSYAGLTESKLLLSYSPCNTGNGNGMGILTHTKPVVIILKYWVYGQTLDLGCFSILAKSSSSLEFLSEMQQDLPTTVFTKFNDTGATFQEELGTECTHVRINVRQSDMLGMSLYLLDIDTWMTRKRREQRDFSARK